MASEQLILKQDGYLDVGCGSGDAAAANGIQIEARNIVYHPNLNVILVFDTINRVKILDVHSGVILQTYQLATNDDKRKVEGRYMPLQDKILIWDGYVLGFRGDYNGVLLLDTILQAAALQNDDTIKLELLLTEAVIFQGCLKGLEQEGLECPCDVTNELAEKIKNAESNVKKGIKAQRWNTICLELPYSSLKLVANNVMMMLKRLERHIPALAIASAINERLTDLLAGARMPDPSWHSTNFQRVLMHSEAVRRQTFEKWPHMDYKWALPDQMAQAGFYHQPSSTGEDRAMCFTCSVCLVCWEKTDEPWSEHERHSPMCPFVKGEYTQNVPISVTYATNPALLAPGYAGFDVISNSDYSNVLCTSCTYTGEITIWSIERQLRQMHTFNIAAIMKDICDADEGYEWARVTAICVLPNSRAQCKIKTINGVHTNSSINTQNITASMAAGGCGLQCSSTSTLRAGVVGSKIILGLSIRQHTGEHLLRMAVLNIVECERNINADNENVATNGSSGGSSFKPLTYAEVVNGALGGANSNTPSSAEGNNADIVLNDQRDDDNKSAASAFDKYAAGYDGNGIAYEMNQFKKSSDGSDGGSVTTDDKCAYSAQLEMFFKNEVMKIDNSCYLPDVTQGDTTSISANVGNSTSNTDMDANYFKEKLLEFTHAAQQMQQNNNNNNNNNNNDIINQVANGIMNGGGLNNNNNVNNNNHHNNINNSNNNNNNNIAILDDNSNNNILGMGKLQMGDEIDCILQSCTIVKRMNALASHRSNSVENGAVDDGEIVEITEILPSDGNCNKLIVKLMKTKPPQVEQIQQIIMANADEDLENEDEGRENQLNLEEVSAQLLMFAFTDSVISNEYMQAITFTRAKCPQQICIVPNFQLTAQHAAQAEANEKEAFEGGALCVVCADGTMELYSLSDFQIITVVEEEGEHFVSVAYCRGLDRLCGCTRNGALIFYSMNDIDNESGDECLEMEDEFNMTILGEQQNSKQSIQNVEISVIDGSENKAEASNEIIANEAGSLLADNSQLLTVNRPQSSPSPSVTSVNSSAVSTANFFAYKNSELTLEDLRMLYDLTLFDDVLSPYTAEVPSCWNDLVQAQKHRKQNMRDDTQFTKTWRLHNDTTTWDEHIIELNLTQPVNLGHIDVKFQMFQPCQSLADVQVTLLKQNTSGFGYRMKGMPVNFNKSTLEDIIDMSSVADGSNENPVLSEEFLQAHNAEILVGPIEMSTCVDLGDIGGTVTLTSPKLFKTRTRNLMIHIKTMNDPAKDNGSKVRGWDGLHEISINVRGVKSPTAVPNERQQRIAMLESNVLLEQLFRIVSNEQSRTLAKNIALDILNWICYIRLNRYRSPKSERIRQQNKRTNANNTDLLTQQFECISLSEKYLENTMRFCIIRADRSMAHKCIKLMATLTNGIINLPAELQGQSSLDSVITAAVTNTFKELPAARYASVVRWYSMLASATSTPKTPNGIPELCVKLLMSIGQEIEKRWEPYSALLGTRFGLYSFPFEPEIFDYDLPTVGKNLTAIPSSLVNITRTNSNATPTNGMDIKKLCSIDGVDFRTFPHLIKCKSVSNQLRGLLEVEQLHFTFASASEATRIDNIDNMATTSGSNLSMEEIYSGPMFVSKMPTDASTDLEVDKGADVEAVKTMLHNLMGIKKKISLIHFPNGEILDKSNKTTPNDKPDENVYKSIPSGVKGVAAAMYYNYKLLKEKNTDGHVNMSSNPSSSYGSLVAEADNNSMQSMNVTQEVQQAEPQTQVQSAQKKPQKEEKSAQENDNSNATVSTVFPWHRLLTPPAKQMIVIDRMHSGAHRFVVIDFGSPVLLTDVVIPSCDELATLIVDIWSFDEETDCVRLAQAFDIGTKTLVLSDLQPPPICRYVKITIIGRIGMSSTKCKVPIGSFFGHSVILESDGYADPFLHYMRHTSYNIRAQIRALKALQEDVHCRYSLASCKLTELLVPILNCELSNIAHMQAFINKQRDEESNSVDSGKVVSTYEECIMLQHQLNVIANVIKRLESALPNGGQVKNVVEMDAEKQLETASRDKLRVLGQNLIEILLHFSLDYGIKNILPVHQSFTMEVANKLFNAFVVYGDAHIQLATCSLLVRMCCFQSWWGDFLADIFCNLFSSQNSKIFPQDRIFFLLTYLGRRSIAMGTCRSIVIDAILKTLAKLLAPISPRYQEAASMARMHASAANGLWAKTDLQLITWLLLFLSACLDDNTDRKDKSANRWDFMSCESDFTKSRSNGNNSSGKQFRCFKRRILQQYKTISQPYNDWGKKIFMIQNEYPGIFMELSGKPKAATKAKASVTPTSSKPSVCPTVSSNATKDLPQTQDGDNNFEKGLRTIRLHNVLIVIRGLIALLLEMDFTCSMDQFLLTCKVIARLVSACRPAVQLSKIITTPQLEQLVRLAAWNDQQQPWAVHAITCLLQDLLDADKHFKDNDATPTNDDSIRVSMEVTPEPRENTTFSDYAPLYANMFVSGADLQLPDGGKYSCLPSLIECEDTEFDEILNEIDLIERTTKNKKDSSNTTGKNIFNYFCKSVSSAMDARLEAGLDWNVEVKLRWLALDSTLNLYASLPQIFTNEFITTPPESATAWPAYITDIWSGPEFNAGSNTYRMFKNVFDCIFADLHLEDTWVHLEQVLQMWLTLNGELSDKSYSAGLTSSEVPKIPFGANAVQGLLLALAWHNDIKLRTWSLAFQCLFLACNSQPISEEDVDTTRIHEVIVTDENFEKMLLRFYSGYGISSSIITNRCAGFTLCKHLHDLITWMYKKSGEQSGVINCKRKLKDTLLQVVLQLVQPGGAITNQHGPIDAQSHLVRDVLSMTSEKADMNVALNIIECVSFLVFNNISNSDKLQCQRTSDIHNGANAFSSLFANVLGSDSSKPTGSLSDNALIISLIKLCASLIQTELPRQPSEASIPEEEELPTESQTDETKAEQLNIEAHRPKTPCIADTVLRHFPTMKRLLGSLSNCNSKSLSTSSSLYTLKPSFLLDEPITTGDAVFNMLMTLCEKASTARLMVSPICKYLETSTLHRNSLPRLQLSEPFLWFISKVLEMPSAVLIFTQLGGIQTICQNLVRLNKVLLNMQPGLISLVMQHMTKNTNMKLIAHASASANGKKSSNNGSNSGSSTANTQPRIFQDGLINFAPFCTVTPVNDNAQSADALLINTVASHRRPRTATWSYMFYPNESHVTLNITLPTALLLKEVQLQPHVPSLASCPSAVAMEVARDYGIGPVPIGPPLTTTGMTCIRLKLAQPEIATAIVLRLYRPKDSSSIGLSQLAILGNTIFAPNAHTSTLNAGVYGNNMQQQNNNMNGLSACVNYMGAGNNIQYDTSNDDDAFAKSSIGWVRILSKCFNAAANLVDTKLSMDVIGSSANYPGFLEACCSLMNIMPMIPNSAQHNLESVILKFANYNCDLCLNIIRILLSNTTPQAYRLTNESICDLLYEMVTTRHSYTLEKVQVLLDWIIKLRTNFSSRTLRCNNPQSGFVKCIASILWTVDDEKLVPQLPELISQELFDSCIYWIDSLDNLEPLKISFDSLLCALCHIKPKLFNQLLLQVGVHMQEDQDEAATCTDDRKGQSGSVWFTHVAAENLSTLLQKPAYLSTVALACQSPLAIYQLVDSGLPKLLAYALYEYCCSLMPHNKSDLHMERPSTSQTTAATCLTDADKAADTASSQEEFMTTAPLLSCAHVPKILDFFSECCSEGLMRDWLGTQQGVIFWKPLLELLCNNRPLDYVTENEPIQQAFVRIERATINFFTRVSACHPKNQDILTTLLIDVIRKPPLSTYGSGKPSISGFTRQIVLQLLLENERILVSVHSKQPFSRRDMSGLGVLQNANSYNNNNGNNLLNAPLGIVVPPTSNGSTINTIPLASVNYHPAKRMNKHHLLFYVSTNTKCEEIWENCIAELRSRDSDTPGNNSASGNLVSTAATTASHMVPCVTVPMASLPMQNNELITPNDMQSEIKSSTPLSDAMSMEFLSVAAALNAKDKRMKEVKNQTTANNEKEMMQNFPKMFNFEDFLMCSNGSNMSNCAQLVHPDYPEIWLTSDTSISQLLALLKNKGHSLSTPCIRLNFMPPTPLADEYDEFQKAVNVEPLATPLQRFSSRGGLSLLAQYLPTVYPEQLMRKPSVNLSEKEKSPPMTDWVKLEPNDEIYEDLEDPVSEPIPKHGSITSVPQHSLAAFGLLLRLPGYSDVLLRDRIRAQCLLRLVLGVTGDGEGNDIYSLSLASTLPTLPFEVFRQLLDSTPLTTDDGMMLRRLVIEVGAMHLVLNSLSIFTHQTQTSQTSVELPVTGVKTSAQTEESSLITADDKGHMYWAKGTGFGTGSTAQSWNVEQALMRQKSEEEHVTVLLQVLSAYINPGDSIPAALLQNVDCQDLSELMVGDLPAMFPALLQQSCLLPALSSYLRNDSVLDITRHIPLYRAILQLLRALSLSPVLVRMLQPQHNGDSFLSISELLTNMKTCVDTYAKRLKVNKKSNLKGQTQQVTVSLDDGDDEGLALLIPDIHETANLVQKTLTADALSQNCADINGMSIMNIDRTPQSKTLEERYIEVMKKLQFDTHDMIVEAEPNGYRFVVSYHFEKMVRMAGDRYHPSRVKRLAQEAVTLSTSLPLSYSSSVFVRCDTDRLDIMKVLITGPADTPYANGCFEFDVFFPPDYPNLPMLINLETTGRHSVRFNPNLYNDGKVCLSVLNTWHGRPEEKWNAQTSSFLQVLVSIQSLILVPEPYFNEPGFERSRGTPSGTQSSREYNSNIYQACVRWAMLEQIRNPSPCFKDVIHTHFWLKRNEICAQIENWIDELNKPQYTGRNNRTISFNSMVLRRQYRHLREEMAKLRVPEGLEDLDKPFNPHVNFSTLNTEGMPPSISRTPIGYTFVQSNSNNNINTNDSKSNNCEQQQQQQQLLEQPEASTTNEDKKQQESNTITSPSPPSHASGSSTSADSCSVSTPVPELLVNDELNNFDDHQSASEYETMSVLHHEVESLFDMEDDENFYKF